jgi:hypothetical protein
MICFIIIIYILFKNSLLNKNLLNLNQSFTQKTKQLEQMNQNCPGPIELPCRQGPKGPQGSSGGLYLEKGPLRNLSEINKVTDRMFNGGIDSYAYLSEQNYKPQQNWTLYSTLGDITNKKNGKKLSNKLQNQYGGCLNINSNDPSY